MGSVEQRSEVLPPEEAFALLGNETRIRILQELGASREPLTFTQLRKRVGLKQGGQFNYHLDKVVGHFVAKTDDGYALRNAGHRVVEAVLSGAVTTDPVLEPQEIDFGCLLCGSPIEVSYRAERLELYCTTCAGQYGLTVKDRESIFPGDHSILGGYQLPPAAVFERSRMELLVASSLWDHLAHVAEANDLCPRCGAVINRSVTVCESHERGDELCTHCQKRHAVQIEAVCTNCPHSLSGMAVNHLAADLELRSFVASQGIDPIVEGFKWGWDYEEEIVAVDPLRARFTFTVRGESVTLTVDESLTVIGVER